MKAIGSELSQVVEQKCAQQFVLGHNSDLSAIFGGKTVQCVEVCQVAAKGLAPLPLRLKMVFTDGSFLVVDRHSTTLPRAKRRIMHLELVAHTKRT